MPSLHSKSLDRRRRVSGSWIRLSLFGACLLSGCSWIPGIGPSSSLVYKIDIQQGVVVTREMAAQLHPGMTRDQVRFVLGTPPLTDIFHANRWDYPFLYKPGRGPVEQRRFTVFFDNDRMTHTAGDPLPTEKEFVANRIRLNATQAKAAGEAAAPASAPAAAGASTSAASDNSAATQAPPPPPEQPSMWQRVKGWFGAGPAPATPPAQPAPAAPQGAPSGPGGHASP